MGFGIEQSVRLIAVTVFVLWEAVGIYSHSRKSHYAERASAHHITAGFFAAIESILGIVLGGKAFQIVAMFLYMEYTLSTVENWPYFTVFLLFFIHTLLNKLWSVLYFARHMYGAAMAVHTVVVLLAITIEVLFCVGHYNMVDGTVWWLPIFFWAFYLASLLMAGGINLRWIVSSKRHPYAPKEMELPTPASDEQPKNSELAYFPTSVTSENSLTQRFLDPRMKNE